MNGAQTYIDTTIRLSLGSDVGVELHVDERSPDDIVLRLGDSAVEISFAPSTVEVLRDKADAALRDSRAAVAKLKSRAVAQRGEPELATAPAADTEPRAGSRVA